MNLTGALPGTKCLRASPLVSRSQPAAFLGFGTSQQAASSRGRLQQCRVATSESVSDKSRTASQPEDLPLPVGSDGLPFVGETPDWLFNYEGFFKERFERYGDNWRTNILGNPTAVVTGHEEVRRLLAAEHKLVESNWPASMRQLLGARSLLTSNAAQHPGMRRRLSQAFTDAAIREYLPVMLEAVNGALAQWAATTAADGQVLGYPAARAFAFDVAALVLTGTRYDGGTIATLRTNFDTFSEGLFSLPVNLPFTKFGKAKRARDTILAEIERLIVEEKAKGPADAPAGGRKARRNALQILISATDDDGKQASMEELKDQILTQPFAGHETTGTTISRWIQPFHARPDIMEGLRREQSELVGRFGPEITADVLEQMPYADAVLQEGLRLNAIVDTVWRTALADLAVNGLRIPKGWTVLLAIRRTIMQTPEFSNPEVFDPTRWLDGPARPIKKDPKGFMPFGDGPRKCLGMLLARAEMRAMLAVWAREYVVEPVDPDEKWFESMSKPVNNLPVRVRRIADPIGVAAPAAAEALAA